MGFANPLLRLITKVFNLVSASCVFDTSVLHEKADNKTKTTNESIIFFIFTVKPPKMIEIEV